MANRFAVIPSQAFEKNLDPQQIALLAFLSLHTDEQGKVTVNYNVISDAMSRSKGWVSQNMRKLEQSGLIKEANGVFSILNDVHYTKRSVYYTEHETAEDSQSTENNVQYTKRPIVRTNLVNNNNKYTLSKDFSPNEKNCARIKERWPEVTNDILATETEKFINHAEANNRKQADWQAAWRNWMIKAQEYRESKNGSFKIRRPSPKEQHDHLKEAAERAKQILKPSKDGTL
ncbi:MAG: helix-turn-helix domain-containing protein [Candidatus Thalassarchaeaceae archaeon]